MQPLFTCQFLLVCLIFFSFVFMTNAIIVKIELFCNLLFFICIRLLLYTILVILFYCCTTEEQVCLGLGETICKPLYETENYVEKMNFQCGVKYKDIQYIFPLSYNTYIYIQIFCFRLKYYNLSISY